MAEVVSVNISVEKGQPKHPVPELCLRLRHGIVGDAHAGDWHRQIGKECHNDCAIRQAVGMCVMPTEGIFAVVVQEGTVRPGDSIEVLEAFS